MRNEVLCGCGVMECNADRVGVVGAQIGNLYGRLLMLSAINCRRDYRLVLKALRACLGAYNCYGIIAF